jgi:Phage Tail Collar Domain
MKRSIAFLALAAAFAIIPRAHASTFEFSYSAPGGARRRNRCSRTCWPHRTGWSDRRYRSNWARRIHTGQSDHLSQNLSTNGVSYTGNQTFIWPGGPCVIGDILLSVNGYLGGSLLPADGRILPITIYPALFSIMGTNFGVNGTDNFAVPDLRPFAPKGLQYSICAEGLFPSRN